MTWSAEAVVGGAGALALSSPWHVQKPETYVQLMPGSPPSPPSASLQPLLYELPGRRNRSVTCLSPSRVSEEGW